MEEIIWTNQAYEHLHSIHKFLSDTIKEEIADKTEERLKKKGPYRYRYLIDSHYKIIYFVDQTNIVITAVFDCRQHPRKMKI
jgi:plasmid stabilization system protein ParE